MPSSAFAAISCAPQQDIAVKEATLGRRNMGLVVLLKPHLANASSPQACEFSVRLIVSSILPSQSEHAHNFALAGPDFQSPSWSACATSFPSNTLNAPTGFQTSFQRWKAAALLRFGLGVAAPFLAFAVEFMAPAFGRRYCLGARACRL